MWVVWRRESCIHGFGGEPEGKRPLGRPWLRWEDNIKIDFPKVECEGMDCIDLAQDRDKWWALLNAVMKLRFRKTREISWLKEPISFSRRTLLRGVSKWYKKQYQNITVKLLIIHHAVALEMFSELIFKLRDLMLPSLSTKSLFLWKVMICDLLDSCFLNMIVTHWSEKLAPL